MGQCLPASSALSADKISVRFKCVTFNTNGIMLEAMECEITASTKPIKISENNISIWMCLDFNMIVPVCQYLQRHSITDLYKLLDKAFKQRSKR